MITLPVILFYTYDSFIIRDEESYIYVKLVTLQTTNEGSTSNI